MQNQYSCLEAFCSIGSSYGYSVEAADVRTVSSLHEMMFKILVNEPEPATGPMGKRAVRGDWRTPSFHC